jgi:CheY-like chemotaxis protein
VYENSTKVVANKECDNTLSNNDTLLKCLSADKEGKPGNKMDQKVLKILIVEDEEAILFAFSRILSSPKLEIHSAQSLNEALDLLGKNAYHAVIADLRLSGTTNDEGYEVIKLAKTSQKDCKIIVMTAFGDDKTKEKVFSLGADLFLEKPISPHKVKEIFTNMGIL